jgi:hypothetical protein
VRQREQERQRDRESKRERDRDTETQRHKETERARERITYILEFCVKFLVSQLQQLQHTTSLSKVICHLFYQFCLKNYNIYLLITLT